MVGVDVPDVGRSMALSVCQLCAVDFSMKRFLLPLIDRMRIEGWEVTGVCSDGVFVSGMRADGYRITTIPIARSMNPILALRTLFSLYRFFRGHRFDVVHTHTPVAALIGRIAAKLAGVPLVLYTAHGFYFHEQMSPWLRRLFVLLEKAAGRFTDFLFTQSSEDAQTAVALRIMQPGKVLAIGNGVDIDRFNPDRVDRMKVRRELLIPTQAVVVGMIGRLVAEKGYHELFFAAEYIARKYPNVFFLIVGERLASDHAAAIDAQLQRAKSLLAERLILTGMREDVPDVLAAMDIFCLPSHREGMPRTIIEAMMMGKPVVATDIRGSREEVVDGETGVLVTVRDSRALTDGLLRLVNDPVKARQMGEQGRVRALALFDERKVVEKQLTALRSLCLARNLKMK
jgi:glycosyltransferase involved in cell wall biosynthesis